MFGVIHADGGKGKHLPIRVHGGGIEPPTEPHLEHRQFNAGLGEGLEGGGGDQLERGEVVAEGHRLQILQQPAQLRRLDQPLGQPDALTPTEQMGGGVEPAADAGGAGDALHHRADRALAIGTGHLHSRKAPLRMAQLRQGRLQPLQPQVDPPAAEGGDQVAEGVVD